MGRKNILVTDQAYVENWDFQKGLETSVGEPFEQISMVSNKMRSRWYNIIRYSLYFINPFKLFLNRKKYNRILCWQSFYGIIFAFYHILFHIKPENEIAITHLIYKPKKGVIGKVYYKWLQWVLKSGYITCYIGGSKTHRDYLIEQFNIPEESIFFVPYCKEDESKKLLSDENPVGEDFVLGVGRSNRDWEWLVKCFAKSKRRLVIICDDFRMGGAQIPANVTILNNVEGDDMLVYMKHCYCQVCVHKYSNVASGEIVYVQGACFSKPFIATAPSCIVDDYVKDGVTGIVVNKDEAELLEVVEKLYNEKDYYETMCKNARKAYESEHDLFQYGRKAGECVIKAGGKQN